jgi:hypothetical protein
MVPAPSRGTLLAHTPTADVSRAFSPSQAISPAGLRSVSPSKSPTPRKSPSSRVCLALVKENPVITIPEIAEKMGIKQNYLYCDGSQPSPRDA